MNSPGCNALRLRADLRAGADRSPDWGWLLAWSVAVVAAQARKRCGLIGRPSVRRVVWVMVFFIVTSDIASPLCPIHSGPVSISRRIPSKAVAQPLTCPTRPAH